MIAYLDTSALVKLYVDETGSNEARESIAQAELATTSRLTYVEARAAIARKVREKELSVDRQTRLVEVLERDWERYLVLEISSALCRLAGALAEAHPLRGGDAIHLASALTAKARTRRQTLFLCFDERLQSAAESEGLLVR
jgi:predicted nucleic acid-binding protein